MKKLSNEVALYGVSIRNKISGSVEEEALGFCGGSSGRSGRGPRQAGVGECVMGCAVTEGAGVHGVRIAVGRADRADTTTGIPLDAEPGSLRANELTINPLGFGLCAIRKGGLSAVTCSVPSSRADEADGIRGWSRLPCRKGLGELRCRRTGRGGL